MSKTIKVADKYSELQKEMCQVLNKADGGASFKEFPWDKELGEGITAVMENGKIIEKAGLNFSHVSGKFSLNMERILGESADYYSATGISSIIHSHNPHVPTIHMNVRYFELDSGVCWFGGGIDLTPAYVNKDEAAWFHRCLKNICDKYSPKFYPEFKPWADDYFFIKHRNETRGIGGIFFDRIKPNKKLSFDSLLAFTTDLAKSYPEIYASIMKRKGDKSYNTSEKDWQKIRRGRYVEFNLVYDRGTKFGLETGGNAESILVSLPAEVTWQYNHTPEFGSEEARTLSLLKKGIDWI